MLHPYVYEKLGGYRLRELEQRQKMRLLRSQLPAQRASVRPVVRFAGVALRRLGEGLESWAAPVCPDMEPQPVRRRAG